jgi:hypothetical protein
VAGQLRRRDGVSVGEGMTGPDEQLVRIVYDAGRLDPGWQVLRWSWDGVEGGVDRTGLDSGHSSVDINVQRHDIKLNAGMYAVEMLDQDSGRNPPAEDVDPQCPPAAARPGPANS